MMVAENTAGNNDFFNLEDGSAAPAENADLSLLNKAALYNVDLDSLEQTAVYPAPAANADAPVEFHPAAKTRSFWQDLDVSLADMVNQVLDSSERPVAIISDDKITYMNPSLLNLLEINSFQDVTDQNFLTYVDKSDWNLLAENIGQMISEGTKIRIRLRSLNNKIHPIELKAVYLPDASHFAFILLGEHQKRENRPLFNSLYDELTGLPNFYLFEDRVQMAVNNENYKDPRLPHNLIAVAAVSVDNLEAFKRLRLENFVIKKLASNLLLSLKKNYTVARGLKYPFWILMPDVSSPEALKLELDKLRGIFKEGVTDNFTTHEVLTSIGVSIFPEPARSGKKLIEQTIAAIKQAIEKPHNSLVLFDPRRSDK